MKITEIRIKLMDEPGERLKAFCSITFDDSFVVRDLKIIDGAGGLFVAMPSRKLADRCPKCGGEFRTQWAEREEDLALPRGPVVSERFEMARNFCNKLWNAARFTLLNLGGYTPASVSEAELLLEDRWLLSRLATICRQTTSALEQYRYAEAMRQLYEFAWDEFCSFYVEMIKARLQDAASRPTAQRILAHALDVLVRLLHPVAPFITEEIWQRLNDAAPSRGLEAPQPAAESVMIAPWPELPARLTDPGIEEQFSRFQTLLSALREIRSRQNIGQRATLRFVLRCQPEMASLLAPMKPYFLRLAGAEAAGMGPDVLPPRTHATVRLACGELYADLEGLIDGIIEFSELGPFIDNQVKNYSSGMYVRLGFSIAINLNPDILLIDEVLAVGDESFQTKCLNRIARMQQEGKTIVLVTHEANIAAAICDRVLWLEKGVEKMLGDPREVTERYHEAMRMRPEGSEFGTREIVIDKVEVLNRHGKEAVEFETGEPMTLRIHYHAARPVEDPVFGFGFYDQMGFMVYGTNTRLRGMTIPKVQGRGTMEFSIASLYMLDGRYYVSVAAHTRDGLVNYHWLDKLFYFDVRSPGMEEGYLAMECDIDLKEE